MSRLHGLAAHLVLNWVYPPTRPSLVPFPIRHTAVNAALGGLLWCHKLGGWLKRGIGVVDPDKSEAKRYQRGNE